MATEVPAITSILFKGTRERQKGHEVICAPFKETSWRFAPTSYWPGVSYLATKNEGRWEFVEQKTSFQQGVQRSLGICPSEKGNRVFQEEAAAGAKMCTYKGAYAFGRQWIDMTGLRVDCVCVSTQMCMYMYVCTYLCHLCGEGLGGILRGRIGQLWGIGGSLDLILQERANHIDFQRVC